MYKYKRGDFVKLIQGYSCWPDTVQACNSGNLVVGQIYPVSHSGHVLNKPSVYIVLPNGKLWGLGEEAVCLVETFIRVKSTKWDWLA